MGEYTVNRRGFLVLVPIAALLLSNCNLNPTTTLLPSDLSAVSLTGQRTMLYWGENMTITAVPANGVSLAWKVDGASLPGETGATVSVGRNLSKGNHHVELTAEKNGVTREIGWDFGITQVPVSELISQMSETEILHTTEDLVNFGTRYFETDGNKAAATYLFERLAALPNLEVQYHSSTYRNVIGTLPSGNPGADVVYIAGAHYDSISTDHEIAPGATDNASGVAIVLEFARIMSQYKFEHSVVFGFWNPEEVGGGGAREYAEGARADSVNIGLYINLDSSSYNPYFPRRFKLDIMFDSNSQWASNMMDANNTLYNIGFDVPLNHNWHSCNSDHLRFREAGYAAVMTHEEEHGPAHSANDTVDKVDTVYAAMNGRLCLSVLGDLAGK